MPSFLHFNCHARRKFSRASVARGGLKALYTHPKNASKSGSLGNLSRDVFSKVSASGASRDRTRNVARRIIPVISFLAVGIRASPDIAENAGSIRRYMSDEPSTFLTSIRVMMLTLNRCSPSWRVGLGIKNNRWSSLRVLTISCCVKPVNASSSTYDTGLPGTHAAEEASGSLEDHLHIRRRAGQSVY